MQLRNLGWNSFFEQHFLVHASDGCVPARVASESHEIYRVLTVEGERLADLAGGLRYRAGDRAAFPAVGDWVAFEGSGESERGLLQAVLPRRSRLARKAAGERDEVQVLAANVDVVFIVTSLNSDLNARRLERFLTVARQGGVQPVIVLSKADLGGNHGALIERTRAVAGSTPVHITSALSGVGLGELTPYLAPGTTVALLGTSGVGKSTLVNRFFGHEIQATGAIREADDRGRHTTTRRELLPLPGGAVLLDTPGLREIAVWADPEEDQATVSEIFEDIEALAETCHFRDCKHQAEPGCAVRAAIAAGTFEETRLEGYDKLQREAAYLADVREKGAGYAERRRWRTFSKKPGLKR